MMPSLTCWTLLALLCVSLSANGKRLTAASASDGAAERLTRLQTAAHAQRNSQSSSASAATPNEPVEVHLICHSHDDVGWLKTVDQYYYGSNNTIQHAGVQYIIESVIRALLYDPSKKFTYVEQAFFQRWMREQPASMVATVKRLVDNGQLEFANGGWCMHDEATTHYIDMIDQTTLGHRYLTQQFNYTPTIGWQIDPFGHSATQAALLTYEMGFDALFFSRIDYEDKQRRVSSKDLQMLWQASEAAGPENQVFAELFHMGYMSPPWYCFESNCNDEPIRSDPRLDDNNVAGRLESFVWFMTDWASQQKDNIVMALMGGDFQWENAPMWYTNIDRLIEAANADGRLKVIYSTPSQYVAAKHKRGTKLSVKTDDFFPYADNRHGYWSGYYTSRPALKLQVRVTANWLLALKQLAVLLSPSSDAVDDSALASLMEEQATVQHHDAIAGTEKQHVTYDYQKRLSRSLGTALDASMATVAQALTIDGPVQAFEACLQLNMSVCQLTQTATSQKENTVAVVLYNPTAHVAISSVTLPVSSSLIGADGHTDAAIAVLDEMLSPIDAQIATVSRHVARQLINTYESLGIVDAADHTISFPVTVPPLGWSTYFLTTDTDQTTGNKLTSVVTPDSCDATNSDISSIENEYYRVTFDCASHQIVSVTDLTTSVVHPFSQQFMFYNACTNKDQCPQEPDAFQPAGAYIFRPVEHDAHLVEPDQPSLTFQRGVVQQEAHQRVNDWVSQVVRLTAQSPYIEFEWTVGSVDTGEEPHRQGREVVTQYTVASIKSESAFYTDSNGREMMRRVRDVKSGYPQTDRSEPTASNIYPVTTVAWINDTSSETQLSICVDRSQGMASLHDGELQFLLHRRLIGDDWKGLAESLDETQSIIHEPFQRLGDGIVVTGKHYVTLGSSKAAARVVRPLAHQMYAQPVPLFLPLPSGPQQAAEYARTHHTSSSALSAALPPNVEVITLEKHAERVLLRLAHMFGIGEDSELSLPATINLTKLMGGLHIYNLTEMSLSGNQLAADMLNAKLRWPSAGTSDQPPGQVTRKVMYDSTSSQDDSILITLQPMEIKTLAFGFNTRTMHLHPPSLSETVVE